MPGLARYGATVLVLVLGMAVPAAEARPRRPPPPPPGWAVDRVRFEALDAVHPLGVEGVGNYRGVLDVVRAPAGVAVVNELGLEDYVRGISEVPPAWPLEAQKAQAIAARTYVLNEMGRTAPTAHRAVGAHICASQDCQVYAGLAKERQEGSGAWLTAVEATSGQVLLYRGAPIRAMYSSSNGGRTVAGGQPYLRAVDDPDDAKSPLHRWVATVPLATLTPVLGLPGPATGARRTGETVMVTWAGADGAAGEHSLPATEFRDRLNASLPAPAGFPLALPSVRFTTATDEAAGTVVVDGRGWGHGIGMSQWGTLGKATRGRRAADILAAYYGGLRPQRLPPDKLPASVRVAVDLGRGEARVVAPVGRFRVLDGQGQPLAHVATGVWRVLPARRGVRVVPPAEQAGPVRLEAQAEPAEPTAHAPLSLRLRLSAPALVRWVVTQPGHPPFEMEPVVLDAGDSAHPLPPPAAPGEYAVAVEADAGAGRRAGVPLTLRVASPPLALSPATSASTPDERGPSRLPARMAASGLLVLVAAVAGKAGDRRRGRLH
jgi:stage II sporulation protein D